MHSDVVMNDMTRVSIQEGENGFIVTVYHSSRVVRQSMNQPSDVIFDVLGRVGSQPEPENIIQAVSQAMSKMKASAAAPPLRKPVEVYVFTSLDQVTNFLKELFSSNKTT